VLDQPTSDYQPFGQATRHAAAAGQRRQPGPGPCRYADENAGDADRDDADFDADDRRALTG
jgi:hypothetical protein